MSANWTKLFAELKYYRSKKRKAALVRCVWPSITRNSKHLRQSHDLLYFTVMDLVHCGAVRQESVVNEFCGSQPRATAQ